jgi:hypothetical protein
VAFSAAVFVCGAPALALDVGDPGPVATPVGEAGAPAAAAAPSPGETDAVDDAVNAAGELTDVGASGAAGTSGGVVGAATEVETVVTETVEGVGDQAGDTTAAATESTSDGATGVAQPARSAGGGGSSAARHSEPLDTSNSSSSPSDNSAGPSGSSKQSVARLGPGSGPAEGRDRATSARAAGLTVALPKHGRSSPPRGGEARPFFYLVLTERRPIVLRLYALAPCRLLASERLPGRRGRMLIRPLRLFAIDAFAPGRYAITISVASVDHDEDTKTIVLHATARTLVLTQVPDQQPCLPAPAATAANDRAEVAFGVLATSEPGQPTATSNHDPSPDRGQPTRSAILAPTQEPGTDFPPARLMLESGGPSPFVWIFLAAYLAITATTAALTIPRGNPQGRRGRRSLPQRLRDTVFRTSR